MSVYCCADLHGRYDLYCQIKQFLKPEDKVIFLGDATDRGPRSWELMKAILFDKQWQYLCGNHEDMLCNAIYEYIAGEPENIHYYNLACNGGVNTFNSWLMGGQQPDWAHVLRKLDYYTAYTNKNGTRIFLSHAGFTPQLDDHGNLIIPSKRDCLWNREHFEDTWDEINFPDAISIHGHTPIPYLMYTDKIEIDNWNSPCAYYYCDNHKIDLDCGSVWTGTTVLLDLDTFEERIFKVEERGN